jgi:succinate-semialdehyde dehydrogenase/glutarate-semialdehyde dehydrogenase
MIDTVRDLHMFVNGQWVEGRSRERLEVRSPATGRVIATIPQGTREDARDAVAAARSSQRRWAATPLRERIRVCRRVAEVALRHRDQFARLLSLEQGKPYHTEALIEAGAVGIWFDMAAEHAATLETAVLPVENPAKRVFTIRQPRGVYAVITPWNYPLGIPSEYLSAALVTGNTVVWVPAPTTSACAVRLVECLEEAEVPPGVVNLVTGPGPVVGDEIVVHPETDAVAFTGSSATGLTIASRAPGKPLLLELGGNGPTIVLPDADLARGAPAIAFGCFRNAGQVCSATGRILVHHSVHEDLAGRLVEAARKVCLGDPFDPHTTMGPLNNERNAAKVDQHLAEAQQRGARVLFGGGRAEGFPTNLYYRPTVVDGVSPESRLHLEETFGPIAALIPFKDDEEAFAYADASALGLAGAVFTRDIARAFRFAERLRLGTVVINDQSSYWDRTSPSGGASGRRSGIGRQGGRYTLLEMTELKTVVIDVG